MRHVAVLFILGLLCGAPILLSCHRTDREKQILDVKKALSACMMAAESGRAHHEMVEEVEEVSRAAPDVFVVVATDLLDQNPCFPIGVHPIAEVLVRMVSRMDPDSGDTGDLGQSTLCIADACNSNRIVETFVGVVGGGGSGMVEWSDQVFCRMADGLEPQDLFLLYRLQFNYLHFVDSQRLLPVHKLMSNAAVRNAWQFANDRQDGQMPVLLQRLHAGWLISYRNVLQEIIAKWKAQDFPAVER